MSEQTTTDNNVSDIKKLIQNISESQDTDEAVIQVALLNVFILAKVKRTGQSMFDRHDFIAWGAASSALDTIRPRDVDYSGGRREARQQTEETIERSPQTINRGHEAVERALRDMDADDAPRPIRNGLAGTR
jgi:hypothetical protein